MGFDEAKAKAALGVLLHEVFNQGALASAALAKDVDAVGAVGFGEGNGATEVYGSVCLSAEVEHSEERTMLSLYRLWRVCGVIDRWGGGGRVG